MNVSYDAEGDILYLQFLPPTGAMKTREIGDGMLGHYQVDSGELEMVEIWSFLQRASNERGVDVSLGDPGGGAVVRAAF